MARIAARVAGQGSRLHPQIRRDVHALAVHGYEGVLSPNLAGVLDLHVGQFRAGAIMGIGIDGMSCYVRRINTPQNLL